MPGRTPRSPHRSFTRHADVARRLRRTPGEWQHVSTHRSRAVAHTMARRIATGERLPAYLPAGAFEARTVPHDDGGTAVEARFIGEVAAR
ncbi:hypothetical protein [Streptomyces phytophilus]|uniref:hypothetical protein n=1 Tax=Streptomyces phytophilus TaxID=722715 RepID=UPI0015F0EF1D|nr:hypothetical protein [Streptomyces phytophilus]